MDYDDGIFRPQRLYCIPRPRIGNIPITNVYESFVSLLWCILFVYINLDYLYKLPSLDTFLLPVVTALSIWALTFDGGNLLITVSLQNFGS